MNAKIFLTSAISLIFMMAFAQKPSIELTFTAANQSAYLQLDSVKVMNRTQGCDTVLFWPDTVLIMDYLVKISEYKHVRSQFKVFQNYPNPVSDQTSISLYIPAGDKVSIFVTDMFGRSILMTERELDEGIHKFRFIAGQGNFFCFTAQWRGVLSTIKITKSNSSKHRISSLEYAGSNSASVPLKLTKEYQSFLFNSGDELLYIGYAGALQSGIINSPEDSQTYTFQYATNIPCPGVPSVMFEGQVYNTIQIFSQCWLKENLNVGTMIPGYQNMEDNDTIEKYCYLNITANCEKYGGLYKWDEMMKYETQTGTQGICPPGWHLPSDEEWKVLEGAVDSQHKIGSPIWNQYGLRGHDAGMKLKSDTLWYSNGNGTDEYNFSGLPGGYLYNNVVFEYKGMHSLWWSSTDGNITSAWNRYFSYNNPIVDRDYGNNKEFGFSVRCLQD